MQTPSDKKVILLAEDDRDDRELFCEALSEDQNDNTILCTENGREALEKLTQLTNLPDLIFLDINMPVMNGWECLKSLKEDEKFKQIPVIVYSSSSYQREKDVALEMGAACFFTKPDNYYAFKEKLALIVKGNYTNSIG